MRLIFIVQKACKAVPNRKSHGLQATVEHMTRLVETKEKEDGDPEASGVPPMWLLGPPGLETVRRHVLSPGPAGQEPDLLTGTQEGT